MVARRFVAFFVTEAFKDKAEFLHIEYSQPTL
jgi:hypothetical protein